MPERVPVLLLAPHWPPDAGAAAARLSGLARELRALGHELRVVAPTASYLTPQAEDDADDGGALRVQVPARGRGAAANAWHQLQLWRALRDGALATLADFEAEAVLVSSPPPLAALAGLGLRDRRGRELPVVVDQRDLWPDVAVEAGAFAGNSPWALGLRFVEARLLQGAAAVTTVTELKVARLAQRSNRRVSLVPNGVDASWVANAPAREPGVTGFEVLYAGNLGRAQDVPALVPAVAACEGVRATIVGEGEERGALGAAIAATGAPVELHGPEARTRVRERLVRCSCAFVSLRTAELVDAIPSKLLEAMALGVPVLLSAAGEAARLLTEADGGLVAHPGDPASLVAALRRMVEMSGDEREAMGARGREHVLAHFRREQAAERLSAVLAEVAA